MTNNEDICREKRDGVACWYVQGHLSLQVEMPPRGRDQSLTYEDIGDGRTKGC